MRKSVYLLPLLCFHNAHSETVNVAVAANLTHTVTEVSEAFKRDQGGRLSLTFGSSGNFARQIVQGAPYRVFISAGRKYVDFIRDNGRAISGLKPLVNGRISLYIPTRSKLPPPSSLSGALKILQYDDFRKMAIANPEHAPYGVAANQALKSAGVWVISRNKLLLGENAAQSMQFCVSGSVDICIIPRSFLALPQFSGRGAAFPIPENWHQPITQYAVLLDRDNEKSARFFNYLSSDASDVIFRKYGYVPERVVE